MTLQMFMFSSYLEGMLPGEDLWWLWYAGRIGWLCSFCLAFEGWKCWQLLSASIRLGSVFHPWLLPWFLSPALERFLSGSPSCHPDGQVWTVTAESCWPKYRYGILLFERGKPQFSLLRSPGEGRKEGHVCSSDPAYSGFCGGVRAFGRGEQKG